MLHTSFCHYGYGIPAWSWAAVNVVGKDGLWEHGTILYVKPDGLIVHFGCEGRRRELVSYGAAFGYTNWHVDRDAMHPGRVVEVLRRSGPGDPYKWYPGTLLSGFLPDKTGSLLFVEAQQGNISRREVVKSGQVRLPPHLGPQWRSLRIDDFRTWSMRPLPAHVVELLPTSSPLWKAFCHKISRCVWPVFVSSEELVLLARSGICPGPQSQTELLLQRMMAIDGEGVVVQGVSYFHILYGLPVALALAFQCDFGRDDLDFLGKREYLEECMADSCCDKLILKECSLPDFPSGIRFSGSLPASCAEEDWYSMVEKNLPPVDMQPTAHWVAETLVHLQPSDPRRYLWMFHQFISDDPRETNSYQNHRWTEDNLVTVDVAKLSSSALYVLSQCALSQSEFEELEDV